MTATTGRHISSVRNEVVVVLGGIESHDPAARVEVPVYIESHNFLAKS